MLSIKATQPHRIWSLGLAKRCDPGDARAHGIR